MTLPGAPPLPTSRDLHVRVCSLCEFPTELTRLSLAPAFNDSTFNLDDYSGPLPNGPADKPLTGIQIIMMREIGGWPLYAIIMAIGQVSYPQNDLVSMFSKQLAIDVLRNKFPDHPFVRPELARSMAAIRLRRDLPGRVSDLVWPLQIKALCLDPQHTLALLRDRILLDRSSVCLGRLHPGTQNSIGDCDLVVRHCVRGSFHFLRSQFWRGSCKSLTYNLWDACLFRVYRELLLKCGPCVHVSCRELSSFGWQPFGTGAIHSMLHQLVTGRHGGLYASCGPWPPCASYSHTAWPMAFQVRFARLLESNDKY